MDEKLSNNSSSMSPEDSSTQGKPVDIENVNTVPTHDDEKHNKKGFFHKSKKSKQDEKDPKGDPTQESELSYEGRTSSEIAILKDQIVIPEHKVTYFTIFRYATKFDLFLIFLSHFLSICAGAALPLFTIIMGNLTNDFNTFLTTGQGAEAFQDSVNHNTLYFVYLGVGIGVATAIETFLAVDRGEVITARIREQYIRGILRQNIGYFDKIGPGEITNRISSDITLIQEGISEKVNLVYTGFATFFAGLVIGFIKSWRITLILFSTIVAIILVMGGLSSFMMKYILASLSSFGKAATVAEDILSAIRTTTAFGIQSRLSQRYISFVNESFRNGVISGRFLMCMVAGIWTIVYLTYGLAFWQGARFIADGTDNPGNLITVIMCVIIGSISIGAVVPAFQSMGKAVGAAKKVFEAIDRHPVIDSLSDEGDTIPEVSGNIELKNVKFAYPSRPNVTVLENFSLSIKPGQTVALVGSSGSGKSTIIGLIERFYDYLEGSITLDGHELRDLNVRWLRQQLALVSQEPTLFSVSIFENIAFGLIGTPYEHASDEEKMPLIVKACKEANAWDFIQNLPDGLETNVGQQGFLLSGGQKQRIAIARAIVSEPKILLLDEATSALDTKSEGVVQEALDRASAQRTTIVIAHRLSTIKDADNIVVMSSGQIIEQGTHHELLERKGAYYKLVHAQNIRGENEPKKHHEKHESAPETQTTYDDNAVKPITRSLSSSSAGSDVMLAKRKTNASIQSASEQKIKDLEAAGMLNSDVKTRSTITLVKYLLQFTKGYNWMLFIGIAAALGSGAGYPIMAFLYGKILNALMVPPDQYPQMRHDVNVLSGYFVLLAGLEFFIFATLLGVFTWHTQKLVSQIRIKVFEHYLRMDIAFFDDENHSTGALTSTLSKDGQGVEGFGGVTLGQILNSLSVLIGGIIMAIVVNWRLGLVCTACVPLLVGCGFLRVYVLVKLEERSKKVYAKSAEFACESVSAIRTVASLSKENLVWSTYKRSVEDQVRASRIPAGRSGIMYGLAQALLPLIMGLGFWYGATLIKDGKITSYQFFTALVAIVFGAQSAGQVFSYAPSMGKAKQASQNIARIFDIEPTIDPTSTEGDVMTNVVGDIEFRDVHFRYPTRLHVPVLRGLNLTVKRGQYVALVGSSGCGKSTTIGLIERFYEPLAGQVLLDGVDVTTLNVAKYRSHIGLVQQEPVLFYGTIRENILYGLDDDQIQNVTEEDIINAAKKANIHNFIMTLPEGYETNTGSKGTLLSGGQKQRIAIARALIRNPKVLLLDEATSALDSESEKVVQAAIDEAAKGRTTIAVAHRLSTIQNADVIYVFDGGKVVESGTHDELLKLDGLYSQLVKMQDLESK